MMPHVSNGCVQSGRDGRLRIPIALVVALTTTEYELLKLFLQHPRQVLTRDLIYERVWGYDFGGESKVIVAAPLATE